jgi:hypothetical protein
MDEWVGVYVCRYMVGMHVCGWMDGWIDGQVCMQMDG